MSNWSQKILDAISERVDDHANEYEPRTLIVGGPEAKNLTFCNNFTVHVINSVLYGTMPRTLLTADGDHVFRGPDPPAGPRERLFYASEGAARIDHPSLVNEVVAAMLGSTDDPRVWESQKLTDGIDATVPANFTTRFKEWQAFADAGQLVLIALKTASGHGHLATMLPGETVTAGGAGTSWDTDLPFVATAGAKFGASSPQPGEWISKRIGLNWVYGPGEKDSLYMFRRADMTRTHAWLDDPKPAIRVRGFDPSLPTRQLLWEETLRPDVAYTGEDWQDAEIAGALAMDDVLPTVRVTNPLLASSDDVKIDLDGVGEVTLENGLAGTSTTISLPASDVSLGPAATTGIYSMRWRGPLNLERRGALFILQGDTSTKREAILVEMPVEVTGESMSSADGAFLNLLKEIERRPESISAAADKLFSKQYLLDNMIGWSIDGLMCAVALAGTAGGGAIVCLKSAGKIMAEAGFDLIKQVVEYFINNPDASSHVSATELDDIKSMFDVVDIARVGLNIRGIRKNKKVCERVESGLKLGSGGAKVIGKFDKEYDDITTGKGVARLLVQYVFEEAEKATVLICKTTKEKPGS